MRGAEKAVKQPSKNLKAKPPHQKAGHQTSLGRKHERNAKAHKADTQDKEPATTRHKALTHKTQQTLTLATLAQKHNTPT